MQNQNSKFKFLSFALLFCAFCFLLLGIAGHTCVFSGAPGGALVTAAKPNSVSVPAAGAPTTQIEQICSAIYKGDFAAARELLGGSTESKSTAIRQLADIISEYETIDAKRRLVRQTAYQKQLAKLEKFKSSASLHGGSAPEAVAGDANKPREEEFAQGGGPNDVNPNDVNNIPKVLSVIARTASLADEQQKQQLLSDSFVKQIIQNAKARAIQYESQGRWLDEYANCYWWLVAIDPENEAYSNYAEQLLEKANIVSSFQDSPCESHKQRYEKVEKRMFVRAIDVLNSNYVSIIDYRQMATKAIRRCELLAEVVNLSRAVRDTLGIELNAEYSKKGSAWSATLAAISDEADQSPTGISKDKFIDIFEKVLALNSTTVELPNGMLIAEFAEAALSALDPYTNMVWPRQAQDFDKTVTNKFSGIGIEISKRKGLLTVVSLLPDTPAYNSGLDAGDVIETVDGFQTKDMTLTCAVHRITGPAGTKVTLTIRRRGEDKTIDIPITRARITVPTIRGWQRTETGKWLYLVDEERKIGYVRITSFSEKTASDLQKVLNQLEAKELAGLVLDLRSNSGGLLSSAIEVTDKFVAKGLIVSTRPRSVWTSAPAHKKGTHPNYPLVVLINRFSASASEIVAGALQDEVHKRAVLIGERTQGKGSVQGITPYPKGGAQLKYTMAYYHLPSGQKVESQHAVKKQGRKDWGVGPDIEMNLTSSELEKLMNAQRDNDVLVKGDPNSPGGLELKKHTIEETLGVDTHLAAGILVVKSKLIQERVRKAAKL